MKQTIRSNVITDNTYNKKILYSLLRKIASAFIDSDIEHTGGKVEINIVNEHVNDGYELVAFVNVEGNNE